MDLAFRRAVAEARKHGDLYFASLLSEDRILKAFGETRWFWQGWIYTPAVTIWVFLSQCLSADHSCRDAVAGLIAWRLARGLPRCSPETGAYCTAREDLPEEAGSQLMRDTGHEADEEGQTGPAIIVLARILLRRRAEWARIAPRGREGGSRKAMPERNCREKTRCTALGAEGEADLVLNQWLATLTNSPYWRFTRETASSRAPGARK